MENLAFLLAAGILVASLAAAMPQGVLDALQVPAPCRTPGSRPGAFFLPPLHSFQRLPSANLGLV